MRNHIYQTFIPCTTRLRRTQPCSRKTRVLFKNKSGMHGNGYHKLYSGTWHGNTRFCY